MIMIKKNLKWIKWAGGQMVVRITGCKDGLKVESLKCWPDQLTKCRYLQWNQWMGSKFKTIKVFKSKAKSA